MIDLSKQAERRAEEAWEQRYKHGKAARTWGAIASEKPAEAELYTILSDYMAEYEAADAKAQKRFQELAARVGDEKGGGVMLTKERRLRRMKDLIGNAKAALFDVESALPDGPERRAVYALRMRMNDLGPSVLAREVLECDRADGSPKEGA